MQFEKYINKYKKDMENLQTQVLQKDEYINYLNRKIRKHEESFANMKIQTI